MKATLKPRLSDLPPDADGFVTFTEAEQYPNGYHSCLCPVTHEAHRLVPSGTGTEKYRPGNTKTYRCTACDERVTVDAVRLTRTAPLCLTHAQQARTYAPRAKSVTDVRLALAGSAATYHPPVIPQ